MDDHKYDLRYLPLFYKDLKEKVLYIFDVLHNPNGARAILKNFSKEKYILVYNSYLDKNPKEILKILMLEN